MRYGIEVVPFGEFSDPRAVVRLAQAAEAAGWEGVWIWDHVLFPWGAGDPWIALAAVAASTRRLKLITGVSPMPRYQPHLLARMLAGLDVLSEGRVIFGAGLGVAWDLAPFGAPADSKTRAAMADEGLDLLARLLSGEEVTHRGAHYMAEAVRLAPTPVQAPRIPVWIGGDSPAALRRAAKWDGWILGTIDEQGRIVNPPDKIAAQVAVIRGHRAGNDAPFEVAVDGLSQPGDSALARAFEQAGATWWFEGIYGSRGTTDELLRRIQAGPPR
jgi:alkanesulfonate monooxygenase SsuD/methylene tetrahydromethanopterin reductase-like flavin-dependent oxidoreductase (luciferase family)